MDQSELVAQFCAITAADADTAERYLAVADQDLETAVTLFLEGGGASIASQENAVTSQQQRTSRDSSTHDSASAGPRGDSNYNSASVTDEEDDAALSRRLQQEEYNSSNGGSDDVREAIRPVTETLVHPGYGQFGYGARRGRRRTRRPAGIFNQFADPRPSVRRPVNAFGDGTGSSGSESAGDDDFDDMSSARYRPAQLPGQDVETTTGMSNMTPAQSRLARIFQPPFDLISNLDLDMAKDVGRANNKWILVNIQDVREFQCQVLNRDLWSYPKVAGLVKKRFVFLQFNHDSDEGCEFKSLYPFSTYPYVGIIDPRTGEQVKEWTTTPIEPEAFFEDLRGFLTAFSLDPKAKNPLAKVSKRKKDVAHMTEEDQIEYALRQSLGKSDDDSDDDIQAQDISSDSMIYGADSDDFEEFSGFEEDDSDVEIVAESPKTSDKGKSASTAGTSSSAFADYNKEQIQTKSQLQQSPVAGESQLPDAEKSKPTPYEEEEEELTEEDIFASILPSDEPEPVADPTTTTRIQFRLADGTRKIRRFRTTDTVRHMFAVVKSIVESAKYSFFSLTSERKKLMSMLDQTIEQAGLKNSSVLIEILD